MLVLFETPAGYAVFKLLDEKKLQKTENLFHDFETPEGASKVVKLKQFSKFEDTTEALAAATAAIEGKMSKNLKKMLKKIVAKDAHEQLAVADAKLGNVIKDKLNLSCVANSSIQELMRGIRAQMSSLITGIDQKDISAMALGLAHSLSRYKLKFSPDKVDTMVVQAISLLDDLDKELNNYVMRCREWYGWHFPELSKIIGDHLAFARVVTRMRVRTNAVDTDLSDILPEEVEAAVKSAAEISMGTEISTEDIDNIIHLCEQIIELTDYRTQLYEYLKNRMLAIAPNVTVLLGELVGARLIAHAGSLMNLAKHPASTVQILGAEKALFRALKTKHDTPKYGLIYHASLVGQSSAKLKGKMSRMLAAKSALAIRVDALGEDQTFDIGTEFKAKLELKLREMEQTGPMGVSGLGRKKAQYEKYENKSEIKTYNSGMDSTIPAAAKKRKLEESDTDKTPVKAKRQKSDELEVKEEPGAGTGKTPAKAKKRKSTGEVKSGPGADTDKTPAKAKKRKSTGEVKSESGTDTDKTPAKAKKGKSTGEVKSEADDSIATSEKKKKKKKKDK